MTIMNCHTSIIIEPFQARRSKQREHWCWAGSLCKGPSPSCFENEEALETEFPASQHYISVLCGAEFSRKSPFTCINIVVLPYTFVRT